MSTEQATQHGDFWKFFTGQALSALGSSFTEFALPLLVYQLSGSATNLAISFASGMLPYLLFGLIGGAWADRADRKRLMIRVDLSKAALIASIPLLTMLHALPLWWIYAVGFLTTTLSILFNAAQFAAVPSLVASNDLVEANGRITASFTAAELLGPPLAGLIASVLPVVDLLLFDALTFGISALSLAWIGVSFNAGARPERRGIRVDVLEGLRYVWAHPVLRHLAIMMAMVNFVTAVMWAELVLFLKTHLRATNFQYGLFMAAGSLGVVLLSLAAGPLRRRLSFSQVALGTLALSGLLGIALALAPGYWIALPLWIFIPALGALFNINVDSLRQAITPNQLLGRVVSTARVLAWSATPFGALLGGYLVERTNVVLVYVLVGMLRFLIPAVFVFSPLGRAETYLKNRPADVELVGT